jgi:hypothetical protein
MTGNAGQASKVTQIFLYVEFLQRVPFISGPPLVLPPKVEEVCGRMCREQMASFLVSLVSSVSWYRGNHISASSRLTNRKAGADEIARNQVPRTK